MRQVIDGHVAHKRAGDFVVAHAPVQPAQKQGELRDAGQQAAENGVIKMRQGLCSFQQKHPPRTR